jgi:hypothetical protein
LYMRALLDQIEGSLGSKLYYLSLFGALAVPDIAGALDSDNGEADEKKYIDWYQRWVKDPSAQPLRPERKLTSGRVLPAQIDTRLTGKRVWKFRCSLLHQGRAQEDARSPEPRIVFIEPGATRMVDHYSMVNNVAVSIDVNLFCLEIVSGARLWLNAVESTERFKRNYERFARRHPNGLPPYAVGVPVIG